MPTRINKFIAQNGYCSRREADRLIVDGDVVINGKLASLGDTVNPGDKVMVRGEEIETDIKRTYLMLNKPVGLICTTDESKPDNVVSYIDYEKRLFPVGRLDVASSGLLIMTDDGELANRLMHPRYEHEKEYKVRTMEVIEEQQLEKMATGVYLNDGKTRPSVIEQTDKREFLIAVKEGRNRQIRRMCEVVGLEVKSLERIRVANIELGSLKRGDIRSLTHSEVKTLKKICGLN